MEDFKDLEQLLTPKLEISASEALRNRVLSIGEVRDTRRSWKRRVLMFVSTAAVAAVVIGIIFLPGAQIKAHAEELMQEALSLIGNSYIIRMDVRSLPQEAFENFDAELPYIPMTMERDRRNWRVDKGERVACGNDSATYMWVPGKLAIRSKQKGATIEDFGYLLDPAALLNQELANNDSKANISKSAGEITLRMTDKSSRIRYYVFDAKTHQLKNYRVALKSGDKEREVLRTRSISYGTVSAIAPPPEGLDWEEIDDMAGVCRGMSAKDALREILQAFKDWDTDVLSSAFRGYNMTLLKLNYFNASEVKIGEPYSSPDYGDKIIIPYSVRLRNGYIREHQASLRESESDGTWIVDGGF